MTTELLKRIAASDGRNLDLTNLNLSELPIEIQKFNSSLTFLNLSGNKLRNLPNWFQEFGELNTIFAASNLFEEYPNILGKLNKLFMVSFKGNLIKTITEDSLR